MKKFMVFIREDITNLPNMTEEEMQKEIQLYIDWVEGLSKTGNYISGDPLEAKGKYMKSDQVFSDGPFIEAKEAISGYILMQAENINQAVELARGCPVFQAGGVLEVRPIMEY